MSSTNPQNPENVDPISNETPPLPEMPQDAPAYTMPPPPPGPDPTPYAGQETYGAGHRPDDLVRPSKDSRNWAMFSHLSALVVGLIASASGFPALSFLGPLVIYLIKKDESAFVADQAREALNFNITVNIIMLVLFLLTFTIILAIITIPLMIIIGLAALILTVVAGIKASNGERYRYPMTLRLIN